MFPSITLQAEAAVGRDQAGTAAHQRADLSAFADAEVGNRVKAGGSTN